MAITKLGALVAGLSGKIGGAVYNANNTVRTWTKPTTSVTERAATAKARVSSLSNIWQNTLTDAQRVIWNNKAKELTFTNRLGESISISGIALYIKINALLLTAGQSIVAAPPADPVIASTLFTLTGNTTDGVDISAISPALPANATHLIVQRAVGVAQSVYSFRGPYTETSVVTVAALGTLPCEITAAADLTVGTRCFYRFRLVGTTGVVSAEWTQSVDIDA